MHARRLIASAIAVWLICGSTLHAQGFDSGSDGSFGPIDVPFNTQQVLDVPADGIFHATTIRVDLGATLTFRRNALNTPVYLLATGDITIEGLINVSGADGRSSPPVGGAGGPGGFDGGAPGFGPENPPGAGYGPGGGRGGDDFFGAQDRAAGGGAYGGRSTRLSAEDGETYGSPLLVPLVGGSGGGGRAGQPGRGGGGGGGAILLASNTRVDIKTAGRVSAIGGRGGRYNQGSGGAIRIVAPVVAGSGILNVQGGSDRDVGGRGRIRVDVIDRTALELRFQPAAATSIGGFMVVFPDVVPRLDLVEVAGKPIPVGQDEPVLVFLPFGSPPTQQVVVQATDFTGVVPIRVVLTPDSGEPMIIDAQIVMGGAMTASVAVDVELPVNRTTRVTAWTREPVP